MHSCNDSKFKCNNCRPRTRSMRPESRNCRTRCSKKLSTTIISNRQTRMLLLWLILWALFNQTPQKILWRKRRNE